MISKGNLFWGMRFRTCKNFWEQQTPSLVLSQKFLQIQKPHRHYFDCCFELSLSQITRIAIHLVNRLRIKCELLFRHCEILRSKIVAIQNSPSIAEGVRVWVIRIFVIASECVAQTRQSTFARHCEIRQRRIEAIQKKMWIATNRYAIPTMTMSVARQ